MWVWWQWPCAYCHKSGSTDLHNVRDMHLDIRMNDHVAKTMLNFVRNVKGKGDVGDKGGAAGSSLGLCSGEKRKCTSVSNNEDAKPKVKKSATPKPTPKPTPSAPKNHIPFKQCHLYLFYLYFTPQFQNQYQHLQSVMGTGNTVSIGSQVQVGYGTAIPMENHTCSCGFMGIPVPNFWPGEWSYDLVDSLMTCF